jgi:hypothetical protein
MARKKFSCDFETTTDPNDCRVWAYGYMEIGNEKNFKIGNSLNDFMTWVEHIKADLYFHNERFDGEFILHYLLTHGYEYSEKPRKNTFKTSISKMGQWYSLDICYGYKGKRKLHTIIYDSLKKLPFKVSKIAKDFNLPILKGDIDYKQYREPYYTITPQEFTYIKHDIEIIAKALKIQFEQGLTAITNGKDSLDGFKNILGKKYFDKFFPVFSLELNENIRYAYKGGFTWLNEKYARKMVYHGEVFDVNSLYPAVMYDKPLPFGVPIYFEGEYQKDEEYPLYIQRINIDFELKEKHIPTIQIKHGGIFKQNEYLKSSNGDCVEIYVSNVDLEIIKEHYDIYEIVYYEGWKFKSVTGLFNQFIDKWTYIKMNSEGAVKLLAKLMLNSLYGKFATNPDITGKIPYLKADGSVGYKVPKDEDGNEIKSYRDPVYTPMGVFITSWARHTTITTAQKCYDRIIYCDTDSIHLEGFGIPDVIKETVDPKKLGYWKHEGSFIRGKYLRQKTYMEEMIVKPYLYFDKARGRVIERNTKVEVRCAGMTENIKEKVTFDNFKIGFTSNGKLMPKHVKGGIILEDKEFTIK